MIRFGAWSFGGLPAGLRKGKQLCRLAPQQIAILARLLASPGAVVPRSELASLLSGPETNRERQLNSAVARLRAVLIDSGRKPRYIETVAGGYRFIAPVVRDAPAEDVPERSEAVRPQRSVGWLGRKLPRWLGG